MPAVPPFRPTTGSWTQRPPRASSDDARKPTHVTPQPANQPHTTPRRLQDTGDERDTDASATRGGPPAAVAQIPVVVVVRAVQPLRDLRRKRCRDRSARLGRVRHRRQDTRRPRSLRRPCVGWERGPRGRCAATERPPSATALGSPPQPRTRLRGRRMGGQRGRALERPTIRCQPSLARAVRRRRSAVVRGHHHRLRPDPAPPHRTPPQLDGPQLRALPVLPHLPPWVAALTAVGIARPIAYPTGLLLAWSANLLAAECWIRTPAARPALTP